MFLILYLVQPSLGMDDTLFDSLPFEGMWYVMFPVPKILTQTLMCFSFLMPTEPLDLGVSLKVTSSKSVDAKMVLLKTR